MNHLTFLRKRIGLLTVLSCLSVVLSSCATLVGGSSYYAQVVVQNRPKATIYYRGKDVGTGRATIKVPRINADKFAFTVKEEDGQEEEFRYHQKRFRGWAFVASLLFWNVGTTSGSIIIPAGAALDLITGAVWKPDQVENGVTQLSHKSFRYTVSYTSFKPEQPKTATPQEKADALIKLRELQEKDILTQEEFDKEKAKILGE